MKKLNQFVKQNHLKY